MIIVIILIIFTIFYYLKKKRLNKNINNLIVENDIKDNKVEPNKNNEYNLHNENELKNIEIPLNIKND